MSSRRVEVQNLSKNQQEVLRLAITGLERVLQSRVVGLICSDSHGELFAVLPPESEVASMRQLAEINWSAMVRLAEEHNK